MKRLTFITAILTLLTASSCSAQHGQTAHDATPRQQLLTLLDTVVAQHKVIFGHHDDTAYGHTWKYEADRSDVKDVVGDYPGLMNWDLGLIEHNSPVQLDSVPFDFIRDEVRKQDARGGINAFSWHLRNPATGGDSWDTSASPVEMMVTAGTALNDTLYAWLDRAADFFLSLKRADGSHIPVIFRPWHENTGSWFWWGKDYCTPEQYRALWRITYDTFARKGVDNVVWVYSPDKLTTSGEYAERFPGSQYVDVLGVDVYHFNGDEGIDDYRTRVKRQLDGAAAVAAKSGKPIALSETGCESLVVPTWWTSVLMPILEQYPVAYVCVWRNAWNNPKHFYAPYPGQASEESFKEFYANPRTVFAHDLSKIRQNIPNNEK